MIDERWTITEIRKAVASGKLKEPFRAADVNKALGITYGGNFLAKHREDRPDKKFKPYFIRIERGLYRLK